MRVGILSHYRVNVIGAEYHGTDVTSLNASRPDVIILIGDWALGALGLKNKQGPIWWVDNAWSQTKPSTPPGLSVLCVPSIRDLVAFPFWYRAHGTADLGISPLTMKSLVAEATKFEVPPEKKEIA